MKRVSTHQDTLKVAIREGELTCEYQTGTPKTGRSRRHSQNLPICDTVYYRKYSVVTVYESGGDLFNINDLKAICELEKRIVPATPELLYDQCGASLSLGAYIASIRNRSSCQDITRGDVSNAKHLLETCASAYFTRKMSAASTRDECIKNKDFIQNVFGLLVGIDFMRNTNILKTTLALSPRKYDVGFTRRIYEQRLSGDLPEQNGVKLVAFKFDHFKFDQFNRQLLIDAIFPALGLLMIAIILLIYTHSVLIMVLTLFSITTSIIIAYFIYHQIFRLTFFPFLNILTFVFLVGICADDAFVFNDIWSQAKLVIPNGSIIDWIEYTLNHAGLSMFVTSFTTSAAFYANVVSDITSIRLFGIFAGTSILIMYSLMITWFPAGVVFIEKLRQPRNIVAKTVEFRENRAVELETDEANPPPDGDQTPPNTDATSPKTVVEHTPDTGFPTATKPSHRSCPFKYYSVVRSKCSKFMSDIFGKWIPVSLRGYPIWLVAFVALGIGMACAVTVSPGLQRPKSSDFQLFASSHILEQYDLNYKDKFRLELTTENNFYVYVFFGIRAEDNGNYFDPKSFGDLHYDNSFDILRPAAQKWFFEDLCSDIRQQTFFGQNNSWNCFPEVFKQRCTSSMNWVLPLNKTQLDQCLKLYYDQQSCPTFSSARSSLYFQGDKIKGISVAIPTNIPLTNKYETVDGLWNSIEDFSSNVLDKAPEGIQNGWAISWLHFYALQENLGSSTITSLGVSLAFAFCVMLLTSMNWVISVYAIVTIVLTLATTTGALVLAGWELNILESIVISVAVGLSVDFTLHYGVAYIVSSKKGRVDQVKSALGHVGPAVTLAALTTFIAGVFMMFSTVLAYCQLGQFLTLVMAISWLFATFFFMSLCYFAGPVGHFGQINSTKCLSCKVVG
ncbi:dispatched homolog 1-like [Paramuricea clavata]|uniref:Dispatched homolog 1-like n=2 Tax=Paramuricea clavata TaxID=317549 RepID=A0A6S7G398_PARCT|nr:dispatched homolog 1-like [Paramuricea clavata]